MVVLEIALALSALLSIAALVLRMANGPFLWKLGPIHVGVENPSAPIGLLAGFLAVAVLVRSAATRHVAYLRIPILLGMLLLILLIPIQDASKMTMALLYLLALFWLAESVVRGEIPIRRSPFDVAVVAFLGVSLASVFVGNDRNYSLTYFFQMTVPPVIALYSTLGITRDNPIALRAILLAIVCSVVVVLVHGFSRFLSTDETHFFAFAGWYTRTGRFLNLTTPLLLGAAVFPGNALRRAAAAVLTLAALCALALTRSRGAWAGALASIVFLGFTLDRRLFLGLLAAAAIGLCVAPRQLLDHALTMLDVEHFQDESLTSPLKYRPAAWRFAASGIAERPVLGHGLGMKTFDRDFREAHADLPEANGISNAHDVFLEIGYESGLLGLAAFAAFLVSAFAAGFRARSRLAASREFPTSAIALAALAGILVHGLVSHITHDSLAILLFIVIALAWAAVPGSPRAAAVERP